MVAVQIICLVVGVPMLVAGLLRLSNFGENRSPRLGRDLLETDIEGLQQRRVSTGGECISKVGAMICVAISVTMILLVLIIFPAVSWIS